MAPPESRGMQNASLWRGLYRLQRDSSMKGHEGGGELEKYATFGTWERPNGTAQMQKKNWHCRIIVESDFPERLKEDQP